MDNEKNGILEDIFKTITESGDPADTLNRIVGIVAKRYRTDVCSVYEYDPSEETLVLRATVGLNRDGIGQIAMNVKEGLTGLALEEMRPVFVLDPATHPRYKFFTGSGEEAFRTFLGLPLVYHRKIIGVLVVQTLAENGLSEADIPMFSNIAGQVAPIIAYARVLAENKRYGLVSDEASMQSESATPVLQGNFRSGCLRGTVVSSQVAEGYARYWRERIDFDQVADMTGGDAESELLRLEKAFVRAGKDLEQVVRQTRSLSGPDASIIEAHRMMLSDSGLKNKIMAVIRNGHCAEMALKKVILKYVETFEAMDDPYLRERGADVRDIGRRVLGCLVGEHRDPNQIFEKETILIASDISPVDLLAARHTNLKGVVLARGGQTSHTVILAKSLEIPILIGVENLLKSVRQGDFLIIDGASGFVFTNPSPEIHDEYLQIRREKEKSSATLASLKGLPANTRDGVRIRLGANIGLLSDTEAAVKYDADHIGLYRTEFPFLLRKSFPTEEEQTELYTKIVKRIPVGSVTIRTFDVGGDKFLSYMDYPREDNPFLGWRSIRVSLDQEEAFRIQIRAILRTSAFGKVKLLFPMITTIEEIRRAVNLVVEEKEILSRRNIAFDEKIPIGAMIEVPGVARILDRLLRYVDFISIGSNDLVQYLLAVDRNNKKVAGYYDALHPAVIATINDIVTICKAFGKPVSICGEAAANPACAFLYVGMGADRLSTIPSSLPAVKQMIRNMEFAKAKDALEEALQMEDSAGIVDMLKGYMP